MKGFVAVTARYEAWRAARIPVVADDVRHKHELMAGSPFVLLRARCLLAHAGREGRRRSRQRQLQRLAARGRRDDGRAHHARPRRLGRALRVTS
jgi:hypothetical protein